jgi:hypothetical protein
MRLGIGEVSALIDTGAQFSCIRVDVAERAMGMGEPCSFKACWVVCSLADGRRCTVTKAVKCGNPCENLVIFLGPRVQSIERGTLPGDSSVRFFETY